MIGNVLKQDPNTKRFKRTSIFTSPYYTSLSCQQSSKHWTSDNSTKTRNVFLSHVSSFSTIHLLFKCRFVAWQTGFPWKVACHVNVKINKRSFEAFCVWIPLSLIIVPARHVSTLSPTSTRPGCTPLPPTPPSMMNHKRFLRKGGTITMCTISLRIISGAVWESKWPSWDVRPNEPSGFRGSKDILNHASALVTACL